MKKTHQPITSGIKKNARILVFLVLIALSFVAGIYRDQVRSFAVNPFAVFVPKGGDEISARALSLLLKKKDFTLINVHTPYEGEIPQTDAFVPYDQIIANAGSLPKDKNTPIILYCRTGHMSREAIETVRKLGYTNVRHVKGGMDAWKIIGGSILDLSKLEESVLPEKGVTLPVSWGTLGKQLVDLGVINFQEFEKVVTMTDEERAILTSGSDKKITINSQNGQFVVDVLWALGLAQKSIVYDQGPMGQEEKENVANFASTGGWDLARGPAVNYLNRFDLIPLTPDQQKKVGDIAKNVYRPCCGNSTWFPDCNHGMAALAAIELMVAANVPEKEIYKNVLALNTFWFANTYLTTATYFARQGIPWEKVDAKLVLSREYSSAQGAREIAGKVGPLPYKPQQGGSACGT